MAARWGRRRPAMVQERTRQQLLVARVRADAAWPCGSRREVAPRWRRPETICRRRGRGGKIRRRCRGAPDGVFASCRVERRRWGVADLGARSTACWAASAGWASSWRRWWQWRAVAGRATAWERGAQVRASAFYWRFALGRRGTHAEDERRRTAGGTLGFGGAGCGLGCRAGLAGRAAR